MERDRLRASGQICGARTGQRGHTPHVMRRIRLKARVLTMKVLRYRQNNYLISLAPHYSQFAGLFIPSV